MSEIGIDVRAINLSSTTPPREEKGVTAEKTPQKAPSSSSAEDEDGSPIRHIICVKDKVDVKHFEDVEDCFILDFDPFEPVQSSKLSVSDNGGGGGGCSTDIAVVAEKGQVFDPKAINLSSTTPSREEKGVTAERTPQKAPSSSSAEDENGSPIRHIVCVKNKVDVKHFEDVEDCFILDFDPFEPVQLSKLSVSDNGGGGCSTDIAVVAEKGQVFDLKAINLSLTTPSREEKGVTAEKTPQKAPSSSSAEDEDGSPIRHIVCVKNKVDVKHFEDVEDCFILDFDPFEPVQLSKLSVSDNGGGGGSTDITVVAEKGQVACRDYPHSRHLCLKFPFETTPHESYCELCYCYVCDSVAPCGLWKPSHCHAAHIGDWKCKRMLMKQQAAVKK